MKKTVKSKLAIDENSKNIEEIIIPPNKRHEKSHKLSVIKMKHSKVSKFLNYSTVSKFVTRKRTEVNNSSVGQNSVNKNIRFKTLMLIPDFCDYSDECIVAKGRMTIEGSNDDGKIN